MKKDTVTLPRRTSCTRIAHGCAVLHCWNNGFMNSDGTRIIRCIDLAFGYWGEDSDCGLRQRSESAECAAAGISFVNLADS
jgi:hypothetical protein